MRAIRDLRDRNDRPRAACYRCFKPAVACICPSIERVANRTGVFILQHPRERFHAIGTARIARLGLANVRIESCAPWTSDPELREQLPVRTALLYPSSHASDLKSLPEEEMPLHLLVLDGTWVHARKMYEAQTWLHSLRHVRLSPDHPSLYRVRRQPGAGCLSTIEAIVLALRILEPQTTGLEALLRAFCAMVDRQAAYTGAAAGAPSGVDA